MLTLPKTICRFYERVQASGLLSRDSQIIDASLVMVAVPKSRNTRGENQQLKRGKVPDGWDDRPNKACQKDMYAHFTKKHSKNHYDYKNHINIDKRDKLIRRYTITDAAMHDSQAFDDFLDEENEGHLIWADSAYRTQEPEGQLRDQGYSSRIQYKGTSKRGLNKREQKANHTRSKVCARVEHVFGAQKTTQGRGLVRTKGILSQLEKHPILPNGLSAHYDYVALLSSEKEHLQKLEENVSSKFKSQFKNRTINKTLTPSQLISFLDEVRTESLSSGQTVSGYKVKVSYITSTKQEQKLREKTIAKIMLRQ